MNQRRDIWLLIGLGLGSRLAALPWAMTQDADAVSRTMQARAWLEDPALITHGFWGPLHIYLTAAGLALWPDPILSPILVNLVFSVGAAVILYFFTREQFDPRAALTVGVAGLLCPLVFRNSLMPLVEGPFTFFVLLALLLAGRALRPEGSWLQAALAGLALSMAGAGRYEAWLLTPLIAATMFSRAGWRRIPIFLACSALFPLFWTWGNARFSGDWFYITHFSERYISEAEGYNLNVSALMRLIRLFYFPFTLACGLTLPVFALCLGGVGLAVMRRRECARWAIPLLGLTAILVFQATRGKIVIKGRYMVLPAVLALPFMAPALEWMRQRWPGSRKPAWVAAFAIAAMLPLSYAGLGVPGMLGTFYQKNITLIPRVPAPGPQVAALIQAEAARGARSLITDFYGWAETNYPVYVSRLAPERIWYMPGARNQAPDFKDLEKWLGKNPEGLLVMRVGSPLEAWSRSRPRFEVKEIGTIQTQEMRVLVCRYRQS